jgi:hypothetical protein
VSLNKYEFINEFCCDCHCVGPNFFYFHPFDNIICNTRIFLNQIYHPTSLMGPIKSNPHFMKGPIGKVLTILAILAILVVTKISVR